MTRLGKVLLAGLAVSALVLVPISGARSADEPDVGAIRDIWTTYATARVAADAETWLALWDKDALKMSQGKPIRTFADMQAGAPKKFVSGALTGLQIDAEEIVVTGDWACSRGVCSVSWPKDRAEMQADGLFMTILKRQDDGSWKIDRDMAQMNK